MFYPYSTDNSLIGIVEGQKYLHDGWLNVATTPSELGGNNDIFCIIVGRNIPLISESVFHDFPIFISRLWGFRIITETNILRSNFCDF